MHILLQISVYSQSKQAVVTVPMRVMVSYLGTVYKKHYQVATTSHVNVNRVPNVTYSVPTVPLAAWINWSLLLRTGTVS